MQFKVFSYRVGLALEPLDTSLKITAGFDKTEVLEQVKELLKDQDFNVDESTVSFKVKENELYLEGLASDAAERKSIGFCRQNKFDVLRVVNKYKAKICSADI